MNTVQLQSVNRFKFIIKHKYFLFFNYNSYIFQLIVIYGNYLDKEKQRERKQR